MVADDEDDEPVLLVMTAVSDVEYVAVVGLDTVNWIKKAELKAASNSSSLK